MTENTRKKVAQLLKRLANGIIEGKYPESEDLICSVVADLMKDQYTRTEAARYMHISERTFDRYRDEGIIGEPTKTPGRLMYWHRSTLDKAIARLCPHS